MSRSKYKRKVFHPEQERVGEWYPETGPKKMDFLWRVEEKFRREARSRRTLETYMEYVRGYRAWEGEKISEWVESVAERMRAGEIGTSRFNKTLSVARMIVGAITDYLREEWVKDKRREWTDLMFCLAWWAGEEKKVWGRKYAPLVDKRVGKWLGYGDIKKVMDSVDRRTLVGKRDAAVLALLFGMGLRREELTRVKVKDFGYVEKTDELGRKYAGKVTDFRVLRDLRRKGNVRQDIPVPKWVGGLVDEWVEAAGIRDGVLVRKMTNGTVGGEGVTAQSIRKVVVKRSGEAGTEVLTTHDGRRSAAELILSTGGDIRQVQGLLGHANLETTVRYVEKMKGMEKVRAAMDGTGMEVRT